MSSSGKQLQKLRMRLRKNRWSILAIACLLTLFLNFSWTPTAMVQASPSRLLDRIFELSGALLQLRPDTTVFRRGNLEYAYVTLDGYGLFPVAASAPLPGAPNTKTESGLRPVVERVEYLENNLRQIVALDYLPFQLKVTLEASDSDIDSDISVFVSDPKRFPPQEVGRVTQEDARLLGEELADLAETRVEIVRKALIRARAERKPEYLRQQAGKTVAIFLGMLALSWTIYRIQRHLLSKFQHLLQSHPLPKWPTNPRKSSGEGPNQQDPLDSLLHPVLVKLFSTRSPKQQLNTLAREVMRLAQTVLWLGGLVWILQLYPYSRDAGHWLLNLPIRLLLFALLVLLLKRGIDFAIDILIRAWVDRSILTGTASRRHLKRAPSLSIAYKTLTQAAAITIIAIVFLFEGFRLPTVPIVTLAGIVGFASQNLIKDFLNGLFILWEDQYAIGDVVSIGNVSGYVEFISLRITKLRSLDGELISIANGTISTVQNLTNEWSRLNLGVDVAYSTDLDKALHVIETVANLMQNDPDWSELILEPPLVLGVDGFGDNSITIRLLMTTQPMRQWDVGREYRLRLKKAFDEAGITIPFPQRSLWIETPFSKQNSDRQDSSA
ncbi:MAG: mechanosensitive ion channel family protein [Synechococcus sp.]